MKQLTFINTGNIEWWDVDEPKITAGTDALVRPLVVARCDIDFGIARGIVPLPGPFALGHETIGEVIEIGDDVKSCALGDRVVVPFQISCGTCDNCRKGFTNTCRSVTPGAVYGMKPICGVEFGGSLSEKIHVPFADHMLVKVPDEVESTQIASLADNIPDGWRTVVPHLKQNPGADVLIFGSNSLGLYAAAAAVSNGAGRVVYVDYNPLHLQMAKDVGAEVMELRIKPGMDHLGQFPITVDSAQNKDALHLAIRSTAPNGVCTTNSLYFDNDVSLPFLNMYTKGITLLTSRVNSRAEIPDVLDHIACGHMHPEKITNKIVNFSDAAEAMGEKGPKTVFVNDWA